MSVIGFDIGNESCVIAAAKNGAIDVLNDESKRETPSVVSFGEKQRFLGSAGAASATANPKSTISQVKRLIGRVYKDPRVQEDLRLLPFVTSEGPHDGILIELEYLKKKMKFTPVEILGMLFTHLKQIAEKNLESDVVDCVIGIPSYFTDLQRREYLDAAHIAGLNPLRLMHDCTATALGYGMYKTDFHEGGPTNVIFVDIGHCDTQVTVAAFEKGKMNILSHSFDQNLGGRDFDEVLFNHFAKQFTKKYKIDVYSNDRASIRLRASCEKLKKVLSANAEAQISIDCLIEDQDVNGIITREEFEKLSSALLKRVTVPCLKAIEDSGLIIGDISIIELVGSGSRIPAIMKSLTLLFKREPTRTLNASECVARGCALLCAMLSPTRLVPKYEIEDVFPYSIGILVEEDKRQPQNEIMLFTKGEPFPNNHKLPYRITETFYVRIFYTDKTDFPTGVSPEVGCFKIPGEKVKFEFNVNLNEDGIVKMEIVSHLENKPPAHKNYPQRMVAGSQISILSFSPNLNPATTKPELLNAKMREQRLREQDIMVEQVKYQRNTLESFVYDTRSKLSTTYSFASHSDKEKITKSLKETEDWLNEDSDDDFEQDYTGKLKHLQKLLHPIEIRYKKEKAAKARQTCIEDYRLAAESVPLHCKQEIKKEHVNKSPWRIFNRNRAEPVNCTTTTKNDIEGFYRNCNKTTRPKRSGSQPVYSGQMGGPAEQTKDKRKTLENTLRKEIDTELRRNNASQYHSSPNKAKHDKESHQRSYKQTPKSKPSGSQPVNSNSEPVDSSQIDRRAESDQREETVVSVKRDGTVHSEQLNQPIGGDQTSENQAS